MPESDANPSREEHADDEDPSALIRPNDAANRRLVANVHPPDWTNPRPAERYNLVVIGAGTAGLVTAAGAAGLGARVALVERHLMGGDCLNVGCVPSKALIRCARAAYDVRVANTFGVNVPGGFNVDFPAVMQRMRDLRADISPHDSAQRFRDLGVDVFIGDAKFTSHDTVDVGGAKLRFAKACIATGARAAAPPIPGLDTIEYVTNETVFELTELPRTMIVVGAGPIGCEMAQAFSRFGSKVYLIEAEHSVLPREDRSAAELVRAALERDGVTLLCCGKSTTFSPSDGGHRVTLESHGQHHDIAADVVLVSVGRTPNIDGIGLDVAGVRTDKSGVVVDDTLRTSNPRVFAAGDVCSRYKFTHTADFLARIVIQNALFGFVPLMKAKVSALTVPWCTYTDPEIAHVGRTVAELQDAGVPFDTYTVPMSSVDRALLEGHTDGLLKVHTVKDKDTILGATLVARHAGDMISELCLAMTHGVGLGGLAKVMHPYPTTADAIRKAGDAYNRTRLTETTKTIFEKLMAWQR
ncbi:MAG: FAD-containing oxidoreductase [Phycisphaera sp.]|nr:FAD-containing oxidoreductase [Phycisphaera sp.]